MLSGNELSALAGMFAASAMRQSVNQADRRIVSRLIQKNAIARRELKYMDAEEFESLHNLLKAVEKEEGKDGSNG